MGAVGLIAPMFISKLRMLVPLSAIGLAFVMIGAMITHIGRGEPIYTNLVLLAMAALTAYWRKDFFKST